MEVQKIVKGHEIHGKKFQCKKCDVVFADLYQLKSHLKTSHKYKCEKCSSRFDSLKEVKFHTVNIHENNIKCLKIGSLNIGRGLFGKEELLINTINEQNLDICSVSEVDITDFNELKPYSKKGYKTFFSSGKKTQRLFSFSFKTLTR